MPCCIALLGWDSVEMVSVMSETCSVTYCYVISVHSLLLIKENGLPVPVHLYCTGPNQAHRENKAIKKSSSQLYKISICIAI